ncbi:MAG: GvpL/GvpF family gas vesicle protein [Actinomycetota bacterium]
MAETGRYLYAVARNVEQADLSAVSGFRGAPVRLVGHRELVAVVSDVDLEEFGEDGLRKNLEDLRWLEEVARTHHAVVNAVAREAPAAPLRLATICLDDRAVRERLDEWHGALLAALRRVEGRTEWSVKALAARRPATPEASPESAAGPGAGAAYLMRRKAAVAQRESAERAAAALADEVHRELSGHAVASRRLPPQDRRLTGHEGTMTLNGAYLVEDNRAAEFRAAVRELDTGHPDVRLDISGPWPPYSFAVLEEP